MMVLCQVDRVSGREEAASGGITRYAQNPSDIARKWSEVSALGSQITSAGWPWGERGMGRRWVYDIIHKLQCRIYTIFTNRSLQFEYKLGAVLNWYDFVNSPIVSYNQHQQNTWYSTIISICFYGIQGFLYAVLCYTMLLPLPPLTHLRPCSAVLMCCVPSQQQ